MDSPALIKIVRAFIAIDIPEDVRLALSRRQASFRDALTSDHGRGRDVRWADPEGMHFTLKFLGEITAAQAEQVTLALSRIRDFEPFEAVLKGFGFFPSAREPRVFWAGVEPASALKALAARIERELGEAGFEPERRPFSPHLTLARFKSSTPQPALRASAERGAGDTLGRLRVSEFFLIESKLSAGAPAAYRKIARFPCASNE
ncbi:MAG: RNA 2',3'-cyclic phosphodiesterase [Terriglobia bacterium]